MKRLYILIAVTAYACLAGCAREAAPREEEVEISPGKFITISRVDRSHDDNRGLGGEVYSALSIPWNGTNVLFKSSDIPVSLRELDGKLYLIGFDRETNFQKCRLTYFQQDGSTFKKIEPSEYPKQIATHNMWFGVRYGTGMTGNVIDRVELAISLDPTNVYFLRSLTAQIWCQLETGQEYYETEATLIDKTMLLDYIEKHNPIKLTTIIKEEKKEDG